MKNMPCKKVSVSFMNVNFFLGICSRIRFKFLREKFNNWSGEKVNIVNYT